MVEGVTIEEGVPIPSRRFAGPRFEISRVTLGLKQGQNVVCKTAEDYDRARDILRKHGFKYISRWYGDEKVWRVWKK